MKNKMTILYISHYSGLNGAPRSMLDMIKGIGKEKIRPIVLLPSSGPLERELRIRHIKYYIVPYEMDYRVRGKQNFWKEIRTEKINHKAILEIIQIIKIEKVAVVHSNSVAVDVGVRAAYYLRIPHVWHVRELGEEDFGFEHINNRRMRKLFQYSRVMIAISETVKKKYEEKYGLNMLLAYDGIDIDNYYMESDIFTDSKRIRLLLCGDITEQKGQKEALEAIKILHSRGRNEFFLTLVGDGKKDYIKTLYQYINDYGLEDRVKILPFVNNLTQLRAEADISLTCSKMEALGRVTIEAMLAGKCVVGANTGGTKELIGELEKFGYLYQQGNSLSLAESILKACNDLNESKKKTDCARKMIMNKVDLNRYSAMCYQIYHEATEKQS